MVRLQSAAVGQKQTVRAVLVSPDSECSQHATAYQNPFWIIAYTVYPYGPSLIFREHQVGSADTLVSKPRGLPTPAECAEGRSS